MAGLRMGWDSMLLILAICLIVLPGKAAAFGAGNIPSIAQIEGVNWRHGDIEDVLKTLAFLHGKKWTTMMVSRTYFGNWLRDYSQAVDVGSLKGVNAATIRILVWILSFLAHGYATEEFEVTEERLGVYRPEEHIDNPLGYADGQDARKYDPRLRGPVDPRELEIDPRTGMKNYIANESGGWATSAGYLRFSFARCIHFGRVYTHGAAGTSGKEADLCEALRCLGQALHCMEDFSAHSNYCELVLRELGYHEVFPHCGSATEITLPNGKRAYPLVTGTFGAVDFLHSVLGEATDHFTQSEVDEMNIALKNAEMANKAGGLGVPGQRGLFGPSSGGSGGDFISLVGKLPGIGDGFAAQAQNLKSASAAQEHKNANVVPGMSPDFDPVKVAGQIYPILEFRDKIVKAINGMIAKIPGLENLLEHISETLTAFILGLLAPFIRPIIEQVSKVLKDGSSGVIDSSANSQLEPWKNPRCDNPTHSMLSKDHFTNILNSCAGRVAATVLQYVVPRVIYAWENPGVPVDQVVNDVLRAFHHPACRDDRIQIQRDMFETVRLWTNETNLRNQLNHLLSSVSVKNGKNHILPNEKTVGGGGGGGGHVHGPGGGGGGGGHSHGGPSLADFGLGSGSMGNWADLGGGGGGGHGKVANSLWSQIRTRDFDAMQPGGDGPVQSGYMSTSPAPPQASQHSPPSSYGHSGASSSSSGAAASYYSGAAPPAPQQQGYGGGGGGYGDDGRGRGHGYGGGSGGGGGGGGYPGQQQQQQQHQQQPPYGGAAASYWQGGPPPPQGYGGGGGGGYPGQQPPWGGQYPPY
ncbi:heterokaryon incompatibility protein Het-C-domain-containing protein [Diplogelasinospora grovesii]|uniref:Heterokaryon incompatibility protein Het-C-domain-containing protein n=1 Tax=Diplogelasinospora grovesii TaxID=303347 RepID=A0AAN6NI59_9PEZI|nr:heterokaryon incompatibility protein Het-C-domain-containing protein [Diplogelasinospora grovesii]